MSFYETRNGVVPAQTKRAGTPEPSCVSMKSDISMGMPPEFSGKAVKTDPGSLEPSCVSMKSDVSMGMPPEFSGKAVKTDPGSLESSCVSMKSDVSMGMPPEFSGKAVKTDPESLEPSCVSMKSDVSMGMPPEFSGKAVKTDPGSLESSCVSMKSDVSMGMPPEFSGEAVKSDPGSPKPSYVSMKSDVSMGMPPEFSGEAVNSDPRCLFQVFSKCGMCKQVLRDPVSITCKHSFCRQCINCYWDKFSQREDFDCPQCKKRFRTRPVLQMDKVSGGPSSALCYTNLQQDSLLHDVLQRVKGRHKTSMRTKYESLFEGIKLQENQTLLNRIYTQLYIIEGESEGVNEEHEVLQMEKTPRTQHSQDTQIHCNDIFKSLPEQGCEEKRRKMDDKIKTVLTKGVAGIGKTVSVQKFILDWAEGKANQDVDFMFVLPFRELNLIKDDQYSIHKLLLDFLPELQDLDAKMYDECKVVFIFDGLDESQITLRFLDSEMVSDINTSSSVGVLMSNIIRGDLLPSALIWITSRPAAANQIPSKYINRVTEIQGFSDPQKEEYFRKRISDQHQASRIISHIRRSRSLHIMCHIPVFCWISSTVLQNIVEQDDSAEIPQTLTEMYIHFLRIQISIRNQKYDERDPGELLQFNRDVILKLAELAFKQLKKGNILFYEEDLKECDIDVIDASVYSGICTEIFKEESVVHQRKVYCFIHLSFQEFLAAIYVFYCYVINTVEVLRFFDSLHNLLRGAVDKALESENGHLDLFLRFLLGISLDSNQKLLQGLLTNTHSCSGSIEKTTAYIKDKIKHGHNLSADRSINLFLCLFEMKDQTLFREIQEFLKSDKHSEKKLSSALCSTIAYMYQMSEEVLEELDPKKFNTSEEGRRKLLPAVKNCRKALLADCNLTDKSCEIVASALQSSSSVLRELDLSNNDLWDSGVKLLCDGLKSPNCQLEKLRLSGCMVTEEGCYCLASALSSNPSHLRELDLSYNHPGHSGVKMLSDRLNYPNCKLEILNFDHGESFRITPGLRKYACDLTLDRNTVNTHLILSENNKKATYLEEEQPYPDHPERFEHYEQVLCSESLTGRCYWEAEWSGWSHIAVTYRGINRKGGSDCRFGLNEKSWSLVCSGKNYYARHNNARTDIPAPSSCSNMGSNIIGVYLDQPAGSLSFYSVSSETGKMIHIYTFHSTFTEPLYAGFGVGVDSESSVCLC
ncbi:NLR family CARD domain-containing protein 3 [Labeo rohita]|uniref:NLR family CARD domain-containing protein 3 n=1 Tax=Labeo rohita TaxID=84645 RepID=A0ABQ8MK77_LABRO|nr:NACHT, LRR and PYD domains-containing protein 3 isoform X2 [Labeo rohita]KAI2662233.1 NLR family CARD domain-containing protein 3 [Labeo rohita]